MKPKPGKVRLAKWFTTMPPKAKAKIVKDVTQLVLARRTRMCNFLEYKGAPLPSLSALLPFASICNIVVKWEGIGVIRRRVLIVGWAEIDTKVVYRRYASLFFVCGIGQMDNELITLEIVHRYVEVLDRYFGNVRLLPSLVWSPPPLENTNKILKADAHWMVFGVIGL